MIGQNVAWILHICVHVDIQLTIASVQYECAETHGC